MSKNRFRSRHITIEFQNARDQEKVHFFWGEVKADFTQKNNKNSECFTLFNSNTWKAGDNEAQA